MAEKKYAKYIITENIVAAYSPPADVMKSLEEQRKAGNFMEHAPLYSLNNKIIPGGMFTHCHWIWETHGSKGVQIESPHKHDFSEVFGFFGTNRQNPRKLNGEIEFWLDNEKYIIDYSCLIFIPRGLKHAPIVFRNVKSPVFILNAGNTTNYTRS